MDGAKMPMPPLSPAPSSSQSEKRDASKRVTVIQIAACLLILLAAALLRYTGGELFETARDWYRETLNQSLLAGEDWVEEAQTVGAQLISRLTGE